MQRPGITSVLALLLASSPALAQTGSITGTITSADGAQPIAGVHVTIVGAQASALTRDDGRYTIAVQPGTYTVRAARLGFEPDSLAGIVVAAGATATANFQLRPTAAALTEVVVIGYGTREARDVTGAVAKVTAADFNTGRIVTPEQLIQAKVPGVQVISNNDPAGGVTLRLRGGTSVNASNDPLFVVDGVPLSVGGGVSAGQNPLSFLNPNDIESIAVLKDASATAIYGSRGANGVVVITTRTGAPGTQVTYDVSASASSVVRAPNMLDAAQYRAAVQQYQPTNLAIIGDASTDWMKAVQRTAAGQEHNLAFSGGREDMRYRLSLGYLDQGGVVRGTNAERVSAALNYSDRMFGDQLEVRANLRGSRSHNSFTPGGVVGAATAFAPTQPIRTSTGSYFQWDNLILGANNPMSDLELLTDRGVQYRSVGDLETRYNARFLEGLSATVRAGYDVARAERTSFTPSIARGQAPPPMGGNFTRNSPSQLNLLLETFGTYTKQLDRLESTIDLTAGYTYEDYQTETTRAVAQGLSTDLLGPNGIPGATVQQNSVDVQENLLVSFFGRVNYTLRDKYLLTASVRRDGSSRFGPANQWGVFPSAAVAWRLGNEPFMREVGWLSDLKLRLSWGINGNQAFSNYMAYSSYTVGGTLAQVQFGNEFVTTIRPSAVDPNIKWEQTASTDVGLDYALFGNRLSGTIDVYTKKTTDLLFRVPVAAGTNLSNFVTTNIGSVQNRGLELGLNARILDGRSRALTWDASFTASTNSNKLLSIYGSGSTQILTGGISGAVGNNIQVLQPGYPVNSFFVYQHQTSNGKPVYGNGDSTITREQLYVDQNGDGIINEHDLRPYKSPWPKWILSQSSQLGYRNFDVSYTLRAHLGNYVYNNVASNLGHYSALRGDAPGNLEASVLKYGFVEPQYFSDLYVEDASFLRMDNITVGYTVRGLRSFKAVRVYATVQNVFTLTGYSGVDPEAASISATSTFGIDNNIYPRARTLLAGASFTF